MRPLPQRLARGLGALWLSLGVVGFVPGVTERYGAIAFAGQSSRAQLFAVFQTSVLQNLLHVALGVAGVALRRPRGYLVCGAVLGLALWILQLAGGAGWLPLDREGAWLHFGLAAVMLAAAGVTRPTRSSPR